jgi:hypothetical protein
MSEREKYTKGRLSLSRRGEVIAAGAERILLNGVAMPLSVLNGVAMPLSVGSCLDEGRANAQRLVALWNAAEGLSTGQLEAMKPGAIPAVLKGCREALEDLEDDRLNMKPMAAAHALRTALDAAGVGRGEELG